MIPFSKGNSTAVHTPFPEAPRQTDDFYFVLTVFGIALNPGFMRAGKEGFNNEDFQILCMFVDFNLTTDYHR